MTELCLAVYQRYYRLPMIIDQLLAQTDQNFRLNIWNNSGKDLKPFVKKFPKNRLQIINSKINVGSQARFRLVPKTKGNPIIFFDDDEDISENMVEYYRALWEKQKEKAIFGWYTRTFVEDSYIRSFDNPPVGSEVDYIGTGGMVLDRKIFNETPELQNIPRPFDRVEDLYLCYLARKKGIKLIKAMQVFSIYEDGKDQYVQIDKEGLYRRLRDMDFKIIKDNILERIVFNNLADLKEVFDQEGIPFWISEGLLLGLYRDKHVIRGDEDDTDICVWKEDTKKIPKALEKLKEKGFEILDVWNYVDGTLEGAAIARDINKIDIIAAHRKKDVIYYLARNYEKMFGDLEYYAFVFPAKPFEKMGAMEWGGIQFPCPSGVEEFLTARYGNWKTPVKRGEGYSLLVKECNPCIKENWEYDNPEHLL